jgi:CheY-like chemotaxis protein
MVRGLKMTNHENGVAPKGRPLVLYVEDNESNALLVEALFRNRIDADLTICPDAESGLDAATASVPNLIITDIRLPGMSGIEFLHALQAHPNLTGIPVVALSSNAMSKDVEKAEAEGFYRYVTKPIVVSDLTAMINEVLAIQGGIRPPLFDITPDTANWK